MPSAAKKLTTPTVVKPRILQQLPQPSNDSQRAVDYARSRSPLRTIPSRPKPANDNDTEIEGDEEVENEDEFEAGGGRLDSGEDEVTGYESMFGQSTGTEDPENQTQNQGFNDLDNAKRYQRSVATSSFYASQLKQQASIQDAALQFSAMNQDEETRKKMVRDGLKKKYLMLILTGIGIVAFIEEIHRDAFFTKDFPPNWKKYLIFIDIAAVFVSILIMFMPMIIFFMIVFALKDNVSEAFSAFVDLVF